MKNKNAYKDAVEEINEIKRKFPNLTRANRFEILANFYGIPEEEARMADRYLRAIRQVFPKDAVGAQLESEWHMPDYMRNPLNDWDSTFKRTNQLS